MVYIEHNQQISFEDILLVIHGEFTVEQRSHPAKGEKVSVTHSFVLRYGDQDKRFVGFPPRKRSSLSTQVTRSHISLDDSPGHALAFRSELEETTS